VGVGYVMSFAGARPAQDLALLVWSRKRYAQFGFTVNWLPRYGILLGWFIVLLTLLTFF
jgi:hypothetical protein